MKNIGKIALLILSFVVLSLSLVVSAQETVTVISQSNLRSEPNRNSTVLDVLYAGDTVTVIQEVYGESVTIGGRTSNIWLEVNSGEQNGYLWSLLVEYQSSLTSISVDPNYPLSICEDCGYDSLTILSMDWMSREGYFEITNPSEMISTLYSIHGRNIWIGYANGGYDMPEDSRLRYRIVFEVARNVLPGPLLYNGTIYNELVMENDEIQVWFWSSESTNEYYVFPFRSMTSTCVPSGEHCGEHLTGAYAIPASEMQRVLDVVGL